MRSIRWSFSFLACFISVTPVFADGDHARTQKEIDAIIESVTKEYADDLTVSLREAGKALEKAAAEAKDRVPDEYEPYSHEAFLDDTSMFLNPPAGWKPLTKEFADYRVFLERKICLEYASVYGFEFCIRKLRKVRQHPEIEGSPSISPFVPQLELLPLPPPLPPPTGQLYQQPPIRLDLPIKAD